MSDIAGTDARARAQALQTLSAELCELCRKRDHLECDLQAVRDQIAAIIKRLDAHDREALRGFVFAARLSGYDIQLAEDKYNVAQE